MTCFLHAAFPDCRVILTVSTKSSLPSPLLTACYKAHASRLASEPTKSLPRQTWMVDSYTDNPATFRHLLCYNLTNIPESLLSRTEDLPRPARTVVFNLALLHTAVALLPAQGDSLASLHYSNLLNGVERLLSRGSGDLSVTLQCLSTLAVDVYGGCAPKEELTALVREVLSVENCSPNVCVRPHPGVEINTPTRGIAPRDFVQHIIEKAGTEDKGSDPQR